MDFSVDKLPSSKKEINLHWHLNVKDHFDLSQIDIGGNIVNFNKPSVFLHYLAM